MGKKYEGKKGIRICVAKLDTFWPARPRWYLASLEKGSKSAYL